MPLQKNANNWVQIGHFNPTTTGQQSATVGFKPSFIQFETIYHTDSFGNESSASGERYALGQGYAIPSKQLAQSFSSGTASTSGHATYIGDGECVHVRLTGTDGTGDNGSLRAEVVSFDDDGFTIDFTELPTINSNTVTDFFVVWSAA